MKKKFAQNTNESYPGRVPGSEITMLQTFLGFCTVGSLQQMDQNMAYSR